MKLVNKGVTGKLAEHLLDEANITTNKNAIPNDPQSPFVTSGIRIGTPSVTTRGMKEEQMNEIGGLIAKIIMDGESAAQAVKDSVISLCEEFPLYK